MGFQGNHPQIHGRTIQVTRWLIPLSKWVITPAIDGISRVNPLITGVITHLLSGMSHQVMTSYNLPRPLINPYHCGVNCGRADDSLPLLSGKAEPLSTLVIFIKAAGLVAQLPSGNLT